MSTIRVKASRIIPASKEAIYQILADYHEAHKSILPKPYFQKLQVVEGGIGKGTIFDVSMEVMGVKVDYHMVVSEAEEGRKLVEKDETQNVVTTFLIDSVEQGTKVTIITESPASPGFKGFIEKLLNPMIVKKIFKAQLELLEKKSVRMEG